MANAYAKTLDPTGGNNILWNIYQAFHRSFYDAESKFSSLGQNIYTAAQIKDAEHGGLQGEIDEANGGTSIPNVDAIKQGQQKLKNLSIAAELRQASNGMNELPMGFGLPGFINKSISSAANATPYLAAFAADPIAGVGLMYASSVADQQQRILANNPGMNVGKATLMAEAYAAPMAAAQSISLPGVAGLFPAVERTIAKYAAEGSFANYAAHVGVGTAGMDLSTLMQPVGDAISQAIDKDFNPGQSAKEQLIDLWKAQPELLGSMMFLSALGAGKAYHDTDQAAYLAKLIGDDATLKKFGFGDDQISKIQSSSLAEAPQVIAEEAGKRTPENIAQGITLARKDGQANKDAAESHETPTLTTSDDGTHIIMVPDGKGGTQEVYRTKDYEAAKQAIGLAWKAHDSGQIQTLNETLRYFEQADKEQGVERRTYDAKLTPDKEAVTFQDMLEQGTPLEQLKERMRIAGIHEDTALSSVVVDGMTKGDQHEDIIRVLNANPRTAIHERLDATTTRALDSGKVSDAKMTEWVRQTEQATGQKYLQTPEGETPSRQQIVEAVTAIGEEYAAGHFMNGMEAPSALKGYFKAMVRYFNNVLSRAKILREGIKSGKIDPNFEEHLAQGIGLPISERLAPAEAKAKAELMEEPVTQPDKLEQGTFFSISKRDAVKPSDEILSPTGHRDWGVFTHTDEERSGGLLKAGPILLLKGEHWAANKGYGLDHIEAEHASDFAGFSRPMEESIHNVLLNFNEVYEGKDGRLILFKTKPNTVASVELRPQTKNGEQFYSVVTAYPKKNPLWRPEGVRILGGRKATFNQSERSPTRTAQEGTSPNLPLEPLVGKYSDEYLQSLREPVKPDNTSFSISTREQRERIQQELDKRVASSPTARTRIFENAAKRFDAIGKRQDSIMEAFASGNASSSDVLRKDMESNLLELNAILSALPADVRASLSRNWRNPSTGEAGNIYTKYAYLGSDKAKADFLLKQIDRAGELIDRQLSSEYLDRGYRLMDAAQPKNEAGKGLQGKIGAEGHELLNKIADLWHMDEGQVGEYINARNKELADPELSEERRDQLEQEIHLAQIHGNFSDVDEKGNYKVNGADMGADARASAVESLKDIIRDGRLDWKGIREENKAFWDGLRSEAKKAFIGREGEATSAEIAKSREKGQTALSGIENWLDSHLSHLARFDQLLGDAAAYWKRRILDATNDKADRDQKIDHESHSWLIKTIFGEKAADNLANRTRLKMVISDLSKSKDTGATVIENRKFTKTKISRLEAEGYSENPGSWKGTDTELNFLTRTLKGLKSNSRVKYFDVSEPIEGTGDEVKLHLSEMEAIQRLLSWRQPDARVKLERSGMTQDTADKLESFVNKTKEGRAFYDFLKNAYDHYDEINAVYRKMFGVDMPRVKDYAPTSYDTAKANEDPVSLDEYGGGGGSMAGFTKSRQSHSAKIKDSNAWITYQAHMDAVNYWLSHAELVRDVRAVFGNADVLRAAEASAVADRKYLTDFIKFLSRDNSTVGNLTGWNSMFARAASNILSNSALAFNLPVTLKHIIPAMSSAMRMSAGDFALSALRVATMTAERPALFGKDNLYSSKEVMRFANAAHGGSDSDAVQAAKESKGVGRKTKIAIEAAGKWGHSWITSFVHVSNSISSAIAYDGAYREATKLGLSHEEADSVARQKVDEVLHDTSQPVFGVDRPIGEEGNPIQATIARFAGPVRQRFGIAYESTKNTGKTVLSDVPIGQKLGSIGGLSWKLAAAWVIPGLMEHAIKQGWLALLGTKQQQEDADRLSEYIAAAISGPAYGIYWMGPVAVAAVKAALTHDKTYLTTGNPIFDEFNSVASALHRVTNKKGDKQPVKDSISLSKAGMDAAAMLLGLVGLKHSATALASVSGAMNPARLIASKVKDDGKVKNEKKAR